MSRLSILSEEIVNEATVVNEFEQTPVAHLHLDNHVWSWGRTYSKGFRLGASPALGALHRLDNSIRHNAADCLSLDCLCLITIFRYR